MNRRIYTYGLILTLIAIGVAYWVYSNPTEVPAMAPVTTATSATTTAIPAADALAAAVAAKVSDVQTLSSQKSGTRVTGDVISQPSEPPEGSIEYRNEKYGFSYYRSPVAKITEYDEGGGAMTLVHENFEKVRGFQVYIIPYDKPLITEEQFKKDIPSGVRKNVEDTTLDGVRAVTFNSVDEHLGETREIWVIHNGYLYEITTFTGVGQWFAPIIQSWRFI